MIYLDNAATSYPKPAEVIETVKIQWFFMEQIRVEAVMISL